MKFDQNQGLSNQYFQFRQFIIHQDRCAMKVTTDACFFGALVAEELEPQDNIRMALDIGTGTGLVSLMIAQKLPFLKIKAIEINEDAAAQAKENIRLSPWSGHIEVIREDILNYDPAEKFDLIFSNPPFYEKEWVSPDPLKKQAHHNDELPLSALLERISKLMEANGQCWLLLPSKRMEEAKRLIAFQGLQIKKMVLLKNFREKDPIRIIFQLIKKKDPAEEPTKIEYCIFQQQGAYTPEFIRLLQPYYLKL